MFDHKFGAAHSRMSLMRLLPTAPELTGFRSGTNLFFGALIGANLGTISDVPLIEYVFIITFLSLTAIILQIVVATGNILYALTQCIVVILLTLYAFYYEKLFSSLSTDEANQIIATIIVWVAMTTLTKIIGKLVDMKASEATSDE